MTQAEAIKAIQAGDQGSSVSFSESEHPSVLADIYQPDCNIVIWKKGVDTSFALKLTDFLQQTQTLHFEQVLGSNEVSAALKQRLGDTELVAPLIHQVELYVDMFCCLFDLEVAGLRLRTLEHAMCPRFHTDKVPCRLVATFQGQATQWLANESVDRSKLGMASQYMSDKVSGVYRDVEHIRQLDTGDVALLKGESWDGNENKGLVHRSPVLGEGEKRLLMTLDFAE